MREIAWSCLPALLLAACGGTPNEKPDAEIVSVDGSPGAPVAPAPRPDAAPAAPDASICPPLVKTPEATLADACANLETTGHPRHVAISTAELGCDVLGRWRMCHHWAGSGLPFGKANFAGIEVAADGAFWSLVSDGLGHVVRSTDPGDNGTWRADPLNAQGQAIDWTLTYGGGQSFRLYAVFAMSDGSEMVSEVEGIGSAETAFVRTDL
jgi:hypothetical protein